MQTSHLIGVLFAVYAFQAVAMATSDYPIEDIVPESAMTQEIAGWNPKSSLDMPQEAEKTSFPAEGMVDPDTVEQTIFNAKVSPSKHQDAETLIPEAPVTSTLLLDETELKSSDKHDGLASTAEIQVESQQSEKYAKCLAPIKEWTKAYKKRTGSTKWQRPPKKLRKERNKCKKELQGKKNAANAVKNERKAKKNEKYAKKIVKWKATMTNKVVMTDAMRQRIVDEHNRLRRIAAKFVGASNMVELTYDMTLERVAQDYLDRNPTWKGHNYDMDAHYKALGGKPLGIGLGENWSGGKPWHFAQRCASYSGKGTCSEEAVFWSRNGGKLPNGKATGTCHGIDGHYTQVVFAETQRVGCGYIPGRGTLCNYTPIRYGPMWKKGKACSACPGGFTKCDRGLCKVDQGELAKHLDRVKKQQAADAAKERKRKTDRNKAKENHHKKASAIWAKINERKAKKAGKKVSKSKTKTASKPATKKSKTKTASKPPTKDTRIPLSGGNVGNAKNLQACRGECDQDSQCAAGLKCFQRSNGESIPGCSGSGAGKDWDYCYDPKKAATKKSKTKTASKPATKKRKKQAPKATASNKNLPGDAQIWVRTTNTYRCMHGVPPVKWNAAMASSAQQWANKIAKSGRLKHSASYQLKPPAGPAGENLAMGHGSIAKAQAGWYNEIKNCGPFPGCKDGAKGVTGHFTPMVWKGVREIGCATATAKGRPWYVCRYKAGNRLSADTPNMRGAYKTNVLKPRKNAKAECAGAATIENVKIVKTCRAAKKAGKPVQATCGRDRSCYCGRNPDKCTGHKHSAFMQKYCASTCCVNGCCKPAGSAVAKAVAKKKKQGKKCDKTKDNSVGFCQRKRGPKMYRNQCCDWYRSLTCGRMNMFDYCGATCASYNAKRCHAIRSNRPSSPCSRRRSRVAKSRRRATKKVAEKMATGKYTKYKTASECRGSETFKGYITGLASCAGKCKGASTYFIYGRNRSRCRGKKCKCYCEVPGSTKCSVKRHSGYNLYKFAKKKPVAKKVTAKKVTAKKVTAKKVTAKKVTAKPSEKEASKPKASVNLAKGKPTKQSSTGWGGSSGRAVDGNDNQSYRGRSCTHTHRNNKAWWSVNLMGPVKVDTVKVYNRADCCGGRLNGFTVHVDKQQCGGRNRATKTSTVACGGKVGSTVKIALPGRNYLTLCEVKVYGTCVGKCWVPPVNLAKGKPTKQSSTGWGGSSGRAVDGNDNQSYRGRSCTHTHRNNKAWWSVDLQGTYKIDTVKVYNRADCCGGRLNGFSVQLGGKKCAANTRRAGRVTTVACGGKVGSTVKIALPGRNYLTLCEVKVYGSVESSPAQ